MNKNTRQNKQATSESGRSMVEMLGVLAIMGVIAVGGITAYQLTMSKHWVDKLEEASYMRAYTIGNQIRNRRPMSLSAYNKKNEQAYGTFSGDVVDLDTQFGIKISGVNQKVCEGIIGKVGGVSAIRSIVDDSTTALTATDCYEDNNTLTLVYNRDLSKTDIDGNLICEGGCGFYGVCEDGTCVCREDHYGDRCENAPLDCENGGSWNNQTNSCDCVGIYGGKVCTDRACSTDNDCVPFLGAGYKCNKTKGICEIQCVSNTTYVENYGCCPNDQLWNRGCCAGNGAKIQEVDGVQMCRRGSYGCPEGQIYDAKTKKCHLCENVTDIVKNTGFYSCSMCPNLVRVSKWQCAPACTDPDAVLVAGVCKCPLDRPLMPSNDSANPQCLPCDYTGTTDYESPYGSNDTRFTGYYCNRANAGGYSGYCAPGTVGVSFNQTIILKDGTIYKQPAGSSSCKPCSEVDVSALVYQASCESCGGTWFGDSWDNGTCQP